MIRKLFFITMLFWALCTHAQEQDFRTWTNLELEGEVFDLIDFSIAPELRMMSNSSQLDAVLTEVNLSAPLTKFLRLGVEYRFKVSSRENQLHNSNRGGVYIELDERIEDLRLAYRAMYMWEYTDILTSELGGIPEEIHRHKISLKYRKKGWDFTPAISAEGFFTLNPIWDRNESKWRFSFGGQYRLTKDINLGVSYKCQQEFNQNNPLTAHILSVGLEYEL